VTKQSRFRIAYRVYSEERKRKEIQEKIADKETVSSI